MPVAEQVIVSEFDGSSCNVKEDSDVNHGQVRVTGESLDARQRWINKSYSNRIPTLPQEEVEPSRSLLADDVRHEGAKELFELGVPMSARKIEIS